MKKNILKNSGVQSLLASLMCVILGLLIGYIVLLFINPDGAGEAISAVMKNFMTYSKPETQVKYLGNTLVKTAPLLMCSLSILFAYKVGLFNIGVAGQYCIGVALSLYAALAWGWSWTRSWTCPTVFWSCMRASWWASWILRPPRRRSWVCTWPAPRETR